MTNHLTQLSKAMTAIAAVMVLSSTPSIAQEADPAPDTTTETPAADPLAPEPAATETPTASEAAPPPAPKPKVETARAKPAKAAPKPAKASAAVARTTAKAASAPAPAVAAAAAPATEVAPAAPPPVAAPAAAEPASAPAAEPVPAGGTVGALIADVMADDRALAGAGAATLGLFALGGAGIVRRHRRRRRENEAFEARQQFLDQCQTADEEEVLELTPADELRAGPSFARAQGPVHDPVPEKAPRTEIPEEFDLSRFGRHVQAAYRGPTADNPSLSLKYRLRRGAALDQQERMAATEGAPASQPRSEDGGFMLRRERETAREVEHS